MKNYKSFNITHKNSVINLNNYIPYSKNIKSNNYKFNDYNPSSVNNNKTPNKYLSNSSKNFNLLNMNHRNNTNIKHFSSLSFSVKPQKKTQTIFANLHLNNNLLTDHKYVTSPLIQSKEQNNNYNKNKKTLILDLDETLVHSAFRPFERKSDIILKINIDGRNHTIHVLKRPNLDYFLEKISKIFNIIIFTASLPQYAEPLINILDKDNKFDRMFRNNCTKKNGFFIKDLNQIGIDLKDVIIIDNNPISFIINQENGIPILTWYENMNDDELKKLIPLLEHLSSVKDVRPVIDYVINRDKNEIDFHKVNKIIFNNEEINGSYVYINSKENKDINIKYNNYLYNGNNQIFNSPNNNNELYYSLSNMSYDEIQNEGFIDNKNKKINLNNVNVFNNYKMSIIKNKNKKNLFAKTKEIFNISNNKDNNLIKNENNKQMDNNVFDINIFQKTHENKIIKKEINSNNNNYNFKYENLNRNNNLKNNKKFKIPKNFTQEDNIKENNINNKYDFFNYATFNGNIESKNLENIYDNLNNLNNDKNMIKSSKNQNFNNINKYRSNSTKNNNIKNYNLPNNNIGNNKKIEKNFTQNDSGFKNKINKKFNEKMEEEKNYENNIELRRRRLQEMKKKIEEINKDLENSERNFYQTQKNFNNSKLNLNNENTSRHSPSKLNLNNLNENKININTKNLQTINIDNSEYNNHNKNKIQKTNIDINIDIDNYNNNIMEKMNYTNRNMYRSNKNYFDELKIDNNVNINTNSNINSEYLKKMNDDFYYKAQNLKKSKNIFNILKPSNGVNYLNDNKEDKFQFNDDIKQKNNKIKFFNYDETNKENYNV